MKLTIDQINELMKSRLINLENTHGTIRSLRDYLSCSRCFLINAYTVNTFEEEVFIGYNYKSTNWLIMDNESTLARFRNNHDTFPVSLKENI